MIIDQLPNLESVQETDEIPVERGTTTYKTTLQKLKDLVASLLTKADIGLGNVANKDLSNVDNVRQYSAQNPPPYPVTSVNGETGAVTTPQNESGAGYCKMPDGTLICYGTAANVSSGATINFPVSFKGYPAVIITPGYNTATTIRCIFSVGGVGAQSVNVYAWDTTTNAISASTTLTFYWQAIGRWK